MVLIAAILWGILSGYWDPEGSQALASFLAAIAALLLVVRLDRDPWLPERLHDPNDPKGTLYKWYGIGR